MEQVTVRDYARVAWRARGWILALVLLAMFLAAVFGYLQPKVYRATAVLLAPKESQQQGMGNSLGALLSGGSSREGGGFSFPGFSVNLPGATSSLDMYSAILRSRTLREEVIADFAKTWGPAVGSMIVSVQAEPSKDKITLSLTAEATHPQLAADLANNYFEYLDRRMQRSAERDMHRQEAFYRAQLARSVREVEVAEDALLKFQQENRMVVSVDPGTKQNVEAGANLRGAIMAMELQREVMRMRYTDQHSQIREVDKQIAELKKQYSQNLFGKAMDLPPESPTAKGPRKEFFVSVDKMTPTQFAYLRLFRNLKIQEAFYAGALQGLEQMRYSNEGSRPVAVDVLDPALVPGTHVRPNRLFTVTTAAVVALVVAVGAALAREYVVQARATWPRAPQRAPKAGSRPAGPARGANGARVQTGPGVSSETSA